MYNRSSGFTSNAKRTTTAKVKRKETKAETRSMRLVVLVGTEPLSVLTKFNKARHERNNKNAHGVSGVLGIAR